MLHIIYQETLLPQYLTISLNFLLLLLFYLTRHLQNWIFFKVIGPSLITKIFFLTIYLQTGRISNNGNGYQSFVSFLTNFNSIWDLYASLKKISKQKLRSRNKPCITLGLRKSISIKNHLLRDRTLSMYEGSTGGLLWESLNFSLPFHTFEIQKEKWKWNNLWCHKLTCMILLYIISSNLVRWYITNKEIFLNLFCVLKSDCWLVPDPFCFW